VEREAVVQGLPNLLERGSGLTQPKFVFTNNIGKERARCSRDKGNNRPYLCSTAMRHKHQEGNLYNSKSVGYERA